MDEPPRVTISWLGHATVLLDLDGVRLLTDPVLRNRVGPLVRIASPWPSTAAEAIGYVLLSHLHADHTDLPSLRRIGDARVLAPVGSGSWLRRHRLPAAREMKPGDVVNAGPIRVLATPAVHDARRYPLGRRAPAIGYVIRGSASVYFAGDTDLFDGMAELRGRVDVALLPVAGWGPRTGPGHLDPERAARAAAAISPRVAIPIHWGTFALPWAARARDPARPARAFARLTRAYAPGVEVRVLMPGTTTAL